MMSDENILVNPYSNPEVTKVPVREVVTDFAGVSFSSPVFEKTQDQPQGGAASSSFDRGGSDSSDKFRNYGEHVSINLETFGRFGNPKTVKFRPFTVKEVSDLTMCRPDDMIETLVAILNQCKLDNNFQVEDLLIEEMFEVLVGMKLFFHSKDHTHRWICTCQNDLPESERKLSEFPIDLKTLKYKSIEEAEELLRQRFAEMLSQMTQEQKQNYIEKKYGQVLDMTDDQLVKDIQIKEPIQIVNGSDRFEFHFPRVRDMVVGMRMAIDKYTGLMRRVKARQPKHGQPGDMVREEKENELKKLEHEKQKEMAFNFRALSLRSKNGLVMTDKIRIEEFGMIPGNLLSSFIAYTDDIEFGICDERDITCNLCGKTERRVLQREINFLELLPIDMGEKPSAKRNIGNNPSAIIFM